VGPTDRRCLLACDEAADCADGQLCAAHADGSRRCFDATGDCAAPAEEPGPDTDPVEPGPESVEVDPVEPGPDPADGDVVEASQADATSGGDGSGSVDTEGKASGGCGGGEATGGLLGLLGWAMAARRWRRRVEA
jgi:hypothetical protein